MNHQPTPLPHSWSKEGLIAKAQQYCEQMHSCAQDDWRFGFWSTLVLEVLARASLANVSPTLLADPKDWNNLYYALGFTPTATKFIPRSIDMKTVMERLRDIVPGFNSSLEGFALTHLSRRNEELHSGATPFDGLTTSKWLPSFYEVCDVLIRSMGETLELFLGSKETAEIAEKMIALYLLGGSPSPRSRDFYQ